VQTLGNKRRFDNFLKVVKSSHIAFLIILLAKPTVPTATIAGLLGAIADLTTF
jgi:hypothetical protein